MNKKEIKEIQKQFTMENISIREICTVYVDFNKNVICSSTGQFLTMPQSEQFKYMRILSKTLSGKQGKNLVQKEVIDSERKQWLERVRREMKWEDMVNKIIGSYKYAENYMIVLIRGLYDIPGKATDGSEMEDASEEVYDYIMCSLCPVHTGDAVLTYDSTQNRIKSRDREFWVDEPLDGFLWPAFSDRSEDRENMMIYRKKPEEMQESMLYSLTGNQDMTTPKKEKEKFMKLLDDVLGREKDYLTMQTIFINLYEIQLENRENPELLKIGKEELKQLLNLAEVSDEALKRLEQRVGEDEEFIVSNVLDAKYKVETDIAEVKARPEHADKIVTRIIDGQQWLMVPAGAEIEVNGISADVEERKAL